MHIQVWPGQAVFPDYMFNPSTYKWLREQLAAWHKTVPFDGLWLDMNEPASFCEGQTCEPDTTNQTSMHCECVDCLCVWLCVVCCTEDILGGCRCEGQLAWCSSVLC